MKKLFVFISASILAFSCSDEANPSKKDGEDQVPQPVENSGANTEAERAVEATVNDSTNKEIKRDSN